MKNFEIDCLIIGGGVCGLSIASKLSLQSKDLFLIERNRSFGEETSSRNSEVIHAGIYYSEDSLKAELCISGKEMLYEYLLKNDIPFNQCGKYILASSDEEIEKLSKLHNNSLRCGVKDLAYASIPREYDFLSYKEAVFSPSSGVMDSHSYMQSLLNDTERNGGHLQFNNNCIDIQSTSKGFEVKIEDNQTKERYSVLTRLIINCAGLNALKICSMVKKEDRFSLKKIKGEYYSYSGKRKVNHLIYPLPTLNSLGVHVTIDMGGGIKFGPSAYEVHEVDYSISSDQKSNFINSIKNYWPSIDASEIQPGYSGIRATLDGENDFVIDEFVDSDNKMISLLGYVSPGLTSSLATAKKVNSIIGL